MAPSEETRSLSAPTKDGNVDSPVTDKVDSGAPATVSTQKNTSGPKKYPWRFWAVFVSLSVTGLLAALEGTVTSTALPTIAKDLEAGEQYICTAVLPLFGQVADIFGRKWLMISVVAMFALGSGISGGATTTAMLIGGRAVQGVGGGGINMLIDLIVCDLVPLRERGNFMGIIFGVFAIGTSLGPFIGGAIVQNTTWRWVFYLNLPIAEKEIKLREELDTEYGLEKKEKSKSVDAYNI
ncbi:putative Uncharacterized MFS-type transporter [Glarea lozoyensis 74030]|uniref:Putative Uncharacterized MFS-type transporter n=1 Tax=Glarea lozoyensis (strain ATCC 74030 / MF5533) TaxID=1104152 RepID=H0EPN2_GLAL7|nr:putative Uncharacterized MFS-type transporter [Glarea lozoyensis 74030]